MRNKFKFFTFFLALAALGFTACDDDDNKEDIQDDQSDASAVVGQWDVKVMTTTVVTHDGTQESVQEPDVWMDFKEDGTGITSNDIVFSWSLSGSSLSLDFEVPEEDTEETMGGDDESEYTFSFDDLSDFKSVELEVTTLEENIMVLVYAVNYGTMSVAMEMELEKHVRVQ